MSNHACYICSPDNPLRFLRAEDGADAMITIPARFAGPPGNANGGIATGMLGCPARLGAARNGVAHPALTRISTRIRRGVPLKIPLGVVVARAGDVYNVTLSDDDGDIATASVEVAALDAAPKSGDALPGAPNADVAADLAEMARIAEPSHGPFFEETGDHPIPGCFSCGPANADGMRIYPRFASDRDTWARWHPDASFDDGSGALATTIIASALDCSSGICLPVEQQQQLLAEDAFFLLGSLDVRYLRVAPLALDGGYRVVARSLRRDGRKFFGLSALFGADDRLYATAEAVWIVAGIPRSVTFGASK